MLRMRVLAVNCGSSSLKARLIDADGTSRRELLKGEAAGLGTERATLIVTAPDGGRDEEPLDDASHAVALRALLKRIRARGERIDASGHRIVHGGDRFDRPVQVDAAVLREIEAASRLAPLHNAPALAALRTTLAELGSEVPAVATFDTIFHRTMPPEAAFYPIPPDLAERHGIRRYGFHGLAHRWMVERYATLAGAADHVAAWQRLFGVRDQGWAIRRNDDGPHPARGADDGDTFGQCRPGAGDVAGARGGRLVGCGRRSPQPPLWLAWCLRLLWRHARSDHRARAGQRARTAGTRHVRAPRAHGDRGVRRRAQRCGRRGFRWRCR